jgi:hypothetical protein
MAFSLFVLFQDLRCLLRMSQLLRRTSQCIYLGGHGDSRDSSTSFTALLASNLLKLILNHQESRCTETNDMVKFRALFAESSLHKKGKQQTCLQCTCSVSLRVPSYHSFLVLLCQHRYFLLLSFDDRYLQTSPVVADWFVRIYKLVCY